MKKLRILALSSQKGGAGKTTVAMQLAAGLALAGEKVLVADLDPQQSALRWAESCATQAPFPARVIAAGGPLETVVGQLARASKGITVAILDCPPSIEHPHTLAALALARLVVIPVVPSPTDLWSTRAVEQLVLRRIEERPRLRGVLLPNRVQRTALALDVLEVMRDFTLPVLDAALSQRNAYALSAISGGSVFALGRAGDAAQEEVRRLTAAILDQLGETK